MDNSGLICYETNKPVHLDSIQVTAHIHDFVACVESTLEYVNQEDKPVEAEFVFPLDDDSAVYKFEVKIDGRLIVGECQEKQQAQETYDEAMLQGYRAFMLQEDDECGDIFQMNIGNLPEKKKVVISFSYVIKLKTEVDGTVRYKLPVVLNPRYSPVSAKGGTKQHSSTLAYKAASDKPYNLQFTALIKGSKKVKAIQSGKVPIEWKEKENMCFEVKLKESYQFDCDIDLLVDYENIHRSTAMVGKGIRDESGLLSQDIVMLNIFPNISTYETESTNKFEFVFVVDRSGSMQDERMKHAKETLLFFLKSLPVGCLFNIISFGSKYATLFEQGSMLYNEDTLKEAIQLQSSMTADMGGTEILEPLNHMYSSMKVKQGYSRQVFILTDGEVTNTRDVIDLVKKNSTSSRVFTFGIGGASTSLVKGVARAGKGKAEMVTGKDRLQAKVVSCLKQAMQPAVTDMKLHWQLPDDVSVINIPKELPVIFDGDHFVIFGILKGEPYTKSVIVNLTATIGQSDLSESVQVNLENCEVDRNYPIHRLAAKEQIKMLECIENEPGEDSTTKDKIILLSLSTNIVSKHTAFVGIDKDTQEKIMSGGLICTRSFGFGGGFRFPSLGVKKKASSLASSISRQFKGKKKKKKISYGHQKTLASFEQCQNKFDPIEDMDPCESAKGSKKIKKSDDVVSVISLQNFDGSWDFTSDLQKILEIDCESLMVTCNISDKKILATILVISWLEKNHSGRKDEWVIIADKATTWLKTQNLQGHSTEKLKELAETLLT